MMSRAKRTTAILLALLLALAGLTSAQDEMPYYQSADFNVPILVGWQDQSAEGAAQFHEPSASATIRTTMAAGADAESAVAVDLAGWLGLAELAAPVYRGKVNLADGTWHALAYDIDETTAASVMARGAGDRFIVITFLESDPASRTLMLVIAQADEGLADASPEIAAAAMALAGVDMSFLAPVAVNALPSGEWITYAADSVTAMGMVFGNDSYVALREGVPGGLAALADAYNRTLLGFFITPDNSSYLWLGIAVSLLILAALIGSLFWRERNLRKDLALIEQLESADAN